MGSGGWSAVAAIATCTIPGYGATDACAGIHLANATITRVCNVKVASAIDRVVGMQSEPSCVPIYEGMPTWAEQLTAYESEGFEIVGMYEVSRDEPTLRVIEFDVVMVRPGEVRSP